MMLWVQMVLEYCKTSVLVSIASHEHSHPCVNNVYMFVYGAVILMYACSYCIYRMAGNFMYIHVQCIYCCCDEFIFCGPQDNE